MTHWLGTTFRYSIIRSSLPVEFNKEREKDRVVARIRDGLKTWNQGRNDCHYRRFSGFETAFESQSGSSAADHNDSKNTIDFGDGDPCGNGEAANGMAQACVHTSGYRYSSSTKAGSQNVVREADMRFNNAFNFHIRLSHRGCSNRLDLFGLAAHESGHVVGLGDLYADKDQWLTMYGYDQDCRYRRRFLARSDWLGLTRLYSRP